MAQMANGIVSVINVRPGKGKKEALMRTRENFPATVSGRRNRDRGDAGSMKNATGWRSLRQIKAFCSSSTTSCAQDIT